MPVVYSYYVLDIVHRGHVRYMKKAKELAGSEGKHIVGILTDEAAMEKKSRPVITFDERCEVAEALRYVDEVVTQETYSPKENIVKLKPDILIESTSHSPESIQEVERYMKELGGRVVVIPYTTEQSSSDIKETIRANTNLTQKG